jgi:redox-sensitive bicupin YhaK (pirin superfamily)
VGPARRDSINAAKGDETMIQIRRGKDRGHANHGWLDTYHSFSFSDYHDPKFMGFRSLRVINEDWVKPGYGFPAHPHRDMEIITYVLEGSLEHKDSMGTGSVIRPGEIQKMSAGTGVRHSEFNHSKSEPVHLYQIWILPEKEGLKPMYEQKAIPLEDKQGKLRLIASPNPGEGAVQLSQDAQLYTVQLDSGKTVEHKLDDGRYAWVQVTRGAVNVAGSKLNAGDGAAVTQEKLVQLTGAKEGGEVLLFDLA